MTKRAPALERFVRGDAYHILERVLYSERAEFFHCRRGTEGEKRRMRTFFKCASCNIFLCLEKDRNCFKLFHEEML